MHNDINICMITTPALRLSWQRCGCHGNSHVSGGDVVVESECLCERHVEILHVIGATNLTCSVYSSLNSKLIPNSVKSL